MRLVLWKLVSSNLVQILVKSVTLGSANEHFIKNNQYTQSYSQEMVSMLSKANMD